MCDTCRPALGPLCMTHRGGGGQGEERGGENGNGGERAPILYMRERERRMGKMQETDVKRNEKKIPFVS